MFSWFSKVNVNHRPNWCQLPDVVLIKICSFLSDSNKAKFALVCRRWNIVFQLPALWRQKIVVFDGTLAQARRFAAFTRQFGAALQHLTVSLFSAEILYCTCYVHQYTVILFFLQKFRINLY